MKTGQTKTIQRLVDIKAQYAEAAESAYATSSAHVTIAEKVRDDMRDGYLAVVDAKDGVVASSADLEDRDRHIRSLRRMADDAEKKLHACRLKEAEARNVMTQARMERRRFETWLERETLNEAIETRRVERIAEDDVASRKRRVST